MTHWRIVGSRPLRAIVVLLFLWAGGRAAYEFTPPIGEASPSSPKTINSMIIAGRSAPTMPQVRMHTANISPADRNVIARPPQTDKVSQRRLEPPALERLQDSLPSVASQASTESIVPPSNTTVAISPRSDRLPWPSLSSWLLVRDGAAGIAPAGTLGGSQVGARAYLPIAHDIAATARISTPLRIAGAEASAGLALRRGPVMLLLERRIALERGGRDDFSITFAGGVDGVRLPHQFRLDAYGQAGIVGRDGFADGAVRVERRIGGQGNAEIALGGGIWGGAQPGIARVDAGPQLVVRMPVADGTLRASGEWRQRIAGKAQPASGPAVTLGMDF